ncbi:helix-turn-helix domain-containing protein [Blautia sp. HCP28S3_G10]|uniref:helix-turn-helix domain-containing protein n=1 Tax=Blautia sp. HCP28S3_G10 TaxID=3438908 RepID=UPI003F8CCF1C
MEKADETIHDISYWEKSCLFGSYCDIGTLLGISRYYVEITDMLRKKTQPEANNDKILISVKEACELIGLSEKIMRSLMNENCFMVRIGRRTLIDKKKFQKWIDRQS